MVKKVGAKVSLSRKVFSDFFVVKTVWDERSCWVPNVTTLTTVTAFTTLTTLTTISSVNTVSASTNITGNATIIKKYRMLLLYSNKGNFSLTP